MNGYMNKQLFEGRHRKGDGEGGLSVTEEDKAYLQVICACKKAEQY